MALITVITPAYNRAYSLTALYQSLENQNTGNFEWMIVDDGSTDETPALVDELTRRASFPIRSIRKENGGKHTALNAGIRETSTPLTFIVDSDDTVLPGAMAQIEELYRKYASANKIGVFSFLKQNSKGSALVEIPEPEFVGSYIADRIRIPRPGDMAEVFRTEALKQFPFPEFPGEKFLSEDVVWISLGKEYKTVFLNRPIYQCEYLADGLTRNDKKMKFASPLGSMLRGRMLMTKECGLKARVRGAIIYGCYRRCISADLPECLILTDPADRLMVFLLQPASLWFYRKWRKEANG